MQAPRVAAAESAIGDQADAFAQAAAHDVGGRGEHLLHARAAARAFVADHHHVAGFHLARQDSLGGGFLAFEDHGRAR